MAPRASVRRARGNVRENVIVIEAAGHGRSGQDRKRPNLHVLGRILAKRVRDRASIRSAVEMQLMSAQTRISALEEAQDESEDKNWRRPWI